MKILRHRWAHAAVLAAMGFGLAATRLAVHPPLVVGVHKGIEGEALKKTIERYTGERGHAVHVVELPYETLRNAVRDSVQGRDLPWRFDVVMVDDPWLPEIESALELFSEDVVDIDFVEACREAARSRRQPDKFLAVPFVGNSQLLCYRKDKDLAPPKSWDELMRFSVARAAPDRFGYVMRVKSGNSILTDFLPILWEADPDSLSGVPLKLGKKGKLAFQQVDDLGKDRSFATASQDDFDLAAYVLRDKTSMSIIWSAWAMQLENLRGTTPGVLNDFEFGQVPGRPVLGAWLLAVPAISKHKTDAEEFVRFATSKEELVNAARDGNPPPRKSVFLNEELTKKYEKSFPEQLKSLEHARMRPRTGLWRHVEEQVGACLAELNVGLIKVEEAFAGSEKAVNLLNDLAGLEQEKSGVRRQKSECDFR